MDWDRISGNWAHWRSRIQERWGRLTNDELDRIAGRRDRLIRRIQESYGLGRVAAERQLRNWERNLRAVEEFDEAELIVDEDDEPTGMNGRG